MDMLLAHMTDEANGALITAIILMGIAGVTVVAIVVVAIVKIVKLWNE